MRDLVGVDLGKRTSPQISAPDRKGTEDLKTENSAGLKDVVVLGAGGGSKSVHWLLEMINEARNTWNILGFLDENRGLHGTRLCDLSVLGGIDWLETHRPNVVHGVGAPAVRRRFVDLTRPWGLQFATAISPDVRYSRFVTFGEGCLVYTGSILTSHVSVGSHCMINFDCTVGHDAVIEDFCTLAPGVHVSGSCHLEEGVALGAGAVVIPGKRIGRNSVIGAGAVVTTDIPPNSVAVGVPARVIKSRA